MSLSVNSSKNEFEKLLDKSVFTLQEIAQKKMEYFLTRSGSRLEQDVFNSMVENAKNTQFDGKIELISGQKFPDIVAYSLNGTGFGVEVKTTSKNHWKTTGSSIFESTRVENIKNIYLLFGKLAQPVEFMYRKYEECLHTVAVTHSPRYLIDMKAKKTIFDKIDMPYDKIRQLENPFKPIKNYFRQELRTRGEDIWWVDLDDDSSIGNIAVRLWGNLKSEKKDCLRNQAMALFPETFGNSGKKYTKVATWLAARHGIVSPCLRDTFTAGGRINLIVNGNLYQAVPKIFEHLQKNVKSIVQHLQMADVSDLSYYWGTKIQKERIEQWINLVSVHSKSILHKSRLNVAKMILEGIS